MTVKMMMMVNLMVIMATPIEIARVKSPQASKHIQIVQSITYYNVPTHLASCRRLITRGISILF